MPSDQPRWMQSPSVWLPIRDHGLMGHAGALIKRSQNKTRCKLPTRSFMWSLNAQSLKHPISWMRGEARWVHHSLPLSHTYCHRLTLPLFLSLSMSHRAKRLMDASPPPPPSPPRDPAPKLGARLSTVHTIAEYETSIFRSTNESSICRARGG